MILGQKAFANQTLTILPQGIWMSQNIPIFNKSIHSYHSFPFLLKMKIRIEFSSQKIFESIENKKSSN